MDSEILSVSQFVGLLDITLESAYPFVNIEGEVADYKGPNRRGHHYFLIKDQAANLNCVVFAGSLQFPIEEGMVVVIGGRPKYHPIYKFSFVGQKVTPAGEGDIKKAFQLLKSKLDKEGLFIQERKRPLPRIPRKIGLITSGQSAAYADFMKILNQRWGGVEVWLADVQVQGDPAVNQIVKAIDYFNTRPELVDALVITRGGGSAEDLQAFSTEPVTRAVAASRIPTLVGVGHEVDVSLAELAADQRAATPTNAAQILVPDKREVNAALQSASRDLHSGIQRLIAVKKHRLMHMVGTLQHGAQQPSRRVSELHRQLAYLMERRLRTTAAQLESYESQLRLLDPKNVLSRGYSLITNRSGVVVKDAASLKKGDGVMIEFHKGKAQAEVTDVQG